MLFAREWPVLLVVDEEDVLTVSQLAMKRVEVDGVPIKLHMATSKAEAIEMLAACSGPSWGDSPTGSGTSSTSCSRRTSSGGAR